jgi:hypothetical protein
MKRLMLAFSAALLVGLFATLFYKTAAYASSNSGAQVILAADTSDQTSATHQGQKSVTNHGQKSATHHDKRYYRQHKPVARNYDHHYYRDYDYPYYYDPYYYNPYYYDEPGLGIDVPFFHFNIY